MTASRPSSFSSGLLTAARDGFFLLCALGGVMGVLVLAKTLRDEGRQAEHEALAARLPDVARAAPGEAAILEGRIAASVPVLRDGFVAYRRLEYSRRSGWEPTESRTQPLSVETASGVYAIVNDDYVLDRRLPAWTDATQRRPPSGWFQRATFTAGLAVNGPVLAIGRRAPEGEGRFVAQSVVGLSRVDYLARLAQARENTWLVKVQAVLGSLAGFALAWWGFRKRR